MKRYVAMLTALVLSAAAHAAGNAPTGPNKTLPQVPAGIPMQVIADCPAPYHKYTQGVSTSKGEYYCVKANVGCPEGYTGSMDNQTGKLVCTPKITASCPEGWTGGPVDGKLVCTSIPQPQVPCPKATPDWQWGTAYYKQSWNKMGCAANLEPPK